MNLGQNVLYEFVNSKLLQAIEVRKFSVSGRKKGGEWSEMSGRCFCSFSSYLCKSVILKKGLEPNKIRQECWGVTSDGLGSPSRRGGGGVVLHAALRGFNLFIPRII